MLPPSTDRVVISVNPKAGARSAQARVDRLVWLLDQRGFRTEVSTNLDEVADRACHWFAQGRLRTLVGVGGDGTAAELVHRTPAGLPFTMLPSGNENLLATYLRLGGTPEAVCRTITSGPAVQLDAGSANGRVFLLMIGCGFDAYVVDRVHAGREGHLSTRHYFGPILKSLATYDYPQFRIHWPPHDAGPTACRAARLPASPADASWLFGFNLPCYGGRLPLAPRASATDGQLDFCAFRHGSLGTSLRYAAAVLLGQHRHMADCTMRRLDHLRVTSEARVPYQLDGDPGGFLPVDIRVLRRRLTAVIPPEYAERFSQRRPQPQAD